MKYSRTSLTNSGGLLFVRAIALVSATAAISCGVDENSQFGTTQEALGPGDTPLYLSPLSEYPTIEGNGNNQSDPDLGAAGTPFPRFSAADYANGDDLAGPNRLGPREISNLVVDQPTSILNSAGATDMFWQWGQFLDHDFDLALTGSESEPIQVPTGDPDFDPEATGTVVIAFERSLFETLNGVREQINEITSFIDASNVYGSDEARAEALRTLDGTGKLKTSAGDLLPFNVDGFPNAGGASPALFLAGDERANEQVYLTAMHTLWVREHNSWAEFLQDKLSLNGEDTYLLARAMVSAEIQSITYNEFLPILLGPDPLPPYTGYNSSVDPSIGAEFATAAYRFGHTMLSSTLLRTDASGNSIPEGPLELRDSFFAPTEIIDVGLTPFLRGLSDQRAQEIDNMIIDDVRNFLFGNPGSGGLDLASLNLQRGRDHGLADYNTIRVAYGLAPRTSISQISSNPTTVARLQSAYSDVNDMDLWVTGLSEDHLPGAMVGETFSAILRDQFTRSRDGDRFFYETYLPSNLRTLVRHTKLSTIIRRNTEATITDLRHELLVETPAAPNATQGFESTSNWSSSAPLSVNTQYVTDGTKSLNIGGNGFRSLTSSTLPAVLGGKSRLFVDVFVPQVIPEPYWAGAVHSYLTCPSVNVYNWFIASVDLTDMPRGQFNTTTHTISTALRNLLSSNPSDCTVTLALNAMGSSTPYAFDRLRFR